MSLVITDVEWRVFVSNSVSNGNTALLSIQIGNDLNAKPVFQSSTTVNSLNGVTGKNDYSTSGFVVGEGGFLCPSATIIEPFLSFAVVISSIVLHGYLIKD
jgi:hypothetical protein